MTETPVDVDSLPPTEYLILDVLAARARLGEAQWTFPSSVNKSLASLSGRQLIRWKHATIEHHSVAWFTPLGRASTLSPVYAPPYLRALTEASDDDLRDAFVMIGADKRDRLRTFLTGGAA